MPTPTTRVRAPTTLSGNRVVAVAERRGKAEAYKSPKQVRWFFKSRIFWGSHGCRRDSCIILIYLLETERPDSEHQTHTRPGWGLRTATIQNNGMSLTFAHNLSHLHVFDKITRRPFQIPIGYARYFCWSEDLFSPPLWACETAESGRCRGKGTASPEDELSAA